MTWPNHGWYAEPQCRTTSGKTLAFPFHVYARGPVPALITAKVCLFHMLKSRGVEVEWE